MTHVSGSVRAVQGTTPKRGDATFGIVLVDDDEDEAILLRDALDGAEEAQYELEWFASFDAGLRAIREARHDAYLIDYHLGEHSGLDLIRAARELGCRAPLIVLTGSDDPALIQAGIDAGATDFLVKNNVNPALLDRTIRYDIAQAEGLATVAREYVEERRANEAKDDLLSTIAHELRNPLTAMLAWSSLLRRNPASGRLEEGLRTIEQSARIQLQLVDDLLDRARVATGKLRLQLRAVDLRDVVQTATSAAWPAAEAKAVTLATEIEDAPCPVDADPERLQQVFSNLLTNAIKFTPPGGHVWVRLNRAGDTARATVRDDGIGIQPDFLPRVFDPLQQADSSTSRTHSGLGLGLAIVRQLMELHGGSITAESEGEGKGSEFAVTLPLKPLETDLRGEASDTHANRRDAAAAAALADAKVLLVEDDSATRRVLTTALEMHGAAVIQASSVSDARAALDRATPDVVVSDIALPDEDGYALIRHMRHSRDGDESKVPAIALTAYVGPHDTHRVLGSGFDVHLTKPIGAARFVQAVAGVVCREEVLDLTGARHPRRLDE